MGFFLLCRLLKILRQHFKLDCLHLKFRIVQVQFSNPAVSYTHLDVYKRQEIDYTKQSILQFTNESEGIYTRTNEEEMCIRDRL